MCIIVRKITAELEKAPYLAVGMNGKTAFGSLVAGADTDAVPPSLSSETNHIRGLPIGAADRCVCPLIEQPINSHGGTC